MLKMKQDHHLNMNVHLNTKNIVQKQRFAVRIEHFTPQIHLRTQLSKNKIPLGPAEYQHNVKQRNLLQELDRDISSIYITYKLSTFAAL